MKPLPLLTKYSDYKHVPACPVLNGAGDIELYPQADCRNLKAQHQLQKLPVQGLIINNDSEGWQDASEGKDAYH